MADPHMKIMQVLGAKNSGGAELFYFRLVQALQEKADVLCVVREGSWIENRLKMLSIPYKSAPFGGFFDFKTEKLLSEYIEEFKPDVVQGWMNRACSKLPETSVPTVGRMGGFYDLKNYKRCDYLIGNTQELQQYFVEKGFPEEKSFYIPNFAPVPDEKYKVNRADVRLTYGIPEDAKVLFIAGRLHHVKGIDTVIKALRSLPEDVHLLVAGSGKLKNEYQELAKHEGVEKRLHLIGWVDNLTVVASAADIWLVPSRQETLGNVVLDAWAHKLPVVASRTQGPLSLIDEDITGKLFDIEDVDTMVRHIESLINAPKQAETMVEKALETLNLNFSEEIVVEKYMDFYKKVTS